MMAGVGCGGYVDRHAQKLGLITVEDAQSYEEEEEDASSPDSLVGL